MKNIFKILSFILLAVLIAGCSDDDKSFVNGADAQTSEYIKNGIDVNSDSHTIELFVSHSNMPLTYTIEGINQDDWISFQYNEPLQNEDGTVSRLGLFIKANENEIAREATVVLSSGNAYKAIQIWQSAKSTISVSVINHGSQLSIGNAGGSIDFSVSANVDFTVEVNYFSERNLGESDWASVKTDKISDTGYSGCLTIGENHWLGRICQIKFQEVDGVAYDEIVIIQEPREFEDSEDIVVSEPGMLDVLLGNNETNLSRIHSLTLTGPLNGIDFASLRRLIADGSVSQPIEGRMITFDMRHCHIYHGMESPYDYLGYKTQVTEEYNPWKDGVIPAKLFYYALNVTSIIFPSYASVIGENCCYHCDNLERVELPSDIEVIEASAFYNCPKLSEIKLEYSSPLKQLEANSLSTFSLVETLELPATLENIGDNALRMITVKKLHVYWNPENGDKISYLANPPHKTDGCTLYVPEGTLNAYKGATGWNTFPSIIEEPIK